ncbi:MULTISPECIES: DUF5779 family protein [Halobacterium]|uniref:Uncharacterized protein n=3 Tax=Halobacterium salinarum TaxID=2242 RepID=Q9HQR0_HALSA|nr:MULTISPECIES: DUF5779 family protein [Halobacterium]AAG19453.1 hypothetical protein VNG_1046H [Halobacterium salinarum NRC-1]MBB6090137.1 hypothetical protein [Halobacterium salinarum]MCF2165531.1 hypothetical protein [Halobacterium salinarum]MCF2168700.1 hypothetical protein [Halobacterium salinarum]MCF2207512.1 hypothetical protein [Halobacterium salinarum]
MSDGFNLDLRRAEDELDTPADFDGNVTLGVLDGTTPDEEWVEEVTRGNVLFLAVDGDLNALAEGFAGTVKDAGGSLVHFREFLVVSPPDVDVDAGRL